MYVCIMYICTYIGVTCTVSEMHYLLLIQLILWMKILSERNHPDVSRV